MYSGMQTSARIYSKYRATECHGLAPAQSGPFEDIRIVGRLACRWSCGFDRGQEILGRSTRTEGREYHRRLPAWHFLPDVIGAIDVDKLAAEAGMAALASKSFEAFGEGDRKPKRGGVNIAESLSGFQKDDKGVSPADTAAEKADERTLRGIGTQVKGKDFAGKMIGYGETIWGYTEEGMINKAKASTAFQPAIDAMVSAAIAGALQ